MVLRNTSSAFVWTPLAWICWGPTTITGMAKASAAVGILVPVTTNASIFTSGGVAGAGAAAGAVWATATDERPTPRNNASAARDFLTEFRFIGLSVVLWLVRGRGLGPP